MESAPAANAPGRADQPRSWRIAALQIAAIALAGVLIGLTASIYRWDVLTILVITLFTVASELTSVDAGPARVHVSGTGLGLTLAAVLLGGGPAAVVGVLSIAIGWLHTREAPQAFGYNLATYAWFPLITGLFFYGCVQLTGVSDHQPAYYVLVFAAYVLSMTANFAAVAGLTCYLKRVSLLRMVREAFVPMLPAQLFSALLAMGAVYLAVRLGTMGLVVLGLMFVIFQYLVGELLMSKRRSEELQRVATTDELTGLANRERFREVVEERVLEAKRTGVGFAVMLMDLDRFKEINDTLGHHYGDVLLRDLGPRLVSAIGPEGVIARLGGDEFAALPTEPTEDLAVLEQVAARLTDCVADPFAVDELSLEVGASIGIARFPEDGEDSNALMRCADIAMYAAKESQCDYKIYAAEQNQHSVRRLSVLSDIRHALASDEIVVHYQPIVDLDDLTVRGAEGLVRWQHPKLGLIPPGAFVQTVEQTGLIGPLTRRVLEHSIAECAAWRRDGRDLSVAVNLSVRNLLDRDLPKEIERLLDTYSLPPEALQLEITESMIMSDPDRALTTVTRLSGLGVRMSVDDFGTGYSSLANLRRLPINELKIDRSFVSPMLRDESDLIIVRSTINLGHDLGLRIIAEGVEDEATLERLALLGCDLAQGFHLSRPMPADAFNVWLRDTAPWLVAPEPVTPPAPALPPAASSRLAPI
ncbi:MAG TPA: EAL domain-containing protein [Solirubrobacteraceae bacterium]|jgi:diguanylate cyclase (GGDEF)-like protein